MKAPDLNDRAAAGEPPLTWADGEPVGSTGGGRAVEQPRAESEQPRAESEQKKKLRAAYCRLTADELRAPPPEKKFILKPYIPAKDVSVLSGPGGSNKTTMIVFLAVCRALGLRFFDHEEMPTEGETIIVSTEDRIDDYRRKLAALRVELGDQFDAEKLAERIHFFDLSGHSIRMVAATQGGQFMPTALVEELAKVIAEVAPRADWIVMETVSRLTGGVETNESLSIFVEAGQRLTWLCNAALTVVGHVSQDAARGGVADAYASRGGSALGDNGRSTMVLTRITDNNQKLYAREAALDPEEMERLLVLTHPKSNGAPGAKPLVLLRWGNEHGPVLRVARLRHADREPDEAPIERLVELVSQLTAEGTLVTEGLLRGYTGKGETLGFAQKQLPKFIAEAVSGGLLIKRDKPGRGGGEQILPAGSAIGVAS
jgi:hypothetical protein